MWDSETVWESEIGKVEVGKSWVLENEVSVHFQGQILHWVNNIISDNGKVAEEDSEKASSTTYEAGP